jgi:hypothetical protein
VIKGKRLRWLGYLFRTAEPYSCRKLTSSKPEGIRGVGRPSIRWLDSVESDLQNLEIRRWNKKSPDRIQWKNTTKEVEA